MNVSIEQLIADHDLIVAWTDERIDNIDQGVLFVHASWSGASVLALSRLTSVWGESDGLLFLVDADYMPLPLGHQLAPLHGRGETFWLSDGRIIERLNDYGANWESEVHSKNQRLNNPESSSGI